MCRALQNTRPSRGTNSRDFMLSCNATPLRLAVTESIGNGTLMLVATSYEATQGRNRLTFRI